MVNDVKSLEKQFDMVFKGVSASKEGRDILLQMFKIKRAIIQRDYDAMKDQLVFSDAARPNALINYGQLRVLDDFIKRLGE
ncbi:MAG: hypothetical protein [Caudoviricetes sp.]|nr:MAG: hypothetical protein [Caudoviricetes sp.]